MMDIAPEDAWHGAVAREVCTDNPSSEIVVCDGQRFLPRLSRVVLPQRPARSKIFDGAKSYLVTGGLGGFGRQLALWLARHGAGHVVLSTRREPARATIAPLERDLLALGARMMVAPLDVSDEMAVRALLGRISSERAPLAGIFHWAGTTADRPATVMSHDDLHVVLQPKVDGVRALHLASLEFDIDHFVMASSLSALVGNPRQANYAAANAYLDGLAWLRHGAGLPALSVNFGAVAGAGMAAKPATASYLDEAGLPSMSVAAALAGLQAALCSGLPQVSLSRGLDGARWARYDPRCARTDKMSDLLGDVGICSPDQRRLHQQLHGQSPDKRVRIITEELRSLLASLLKSESSAISKEVDLTRMGMDSLTALEFQSAIAQEFGTLVPITSLIAGQTLVDVGANIERTMIDV